MASVPEMTNEGTSAPGEPFIFPSYGNIGPPHIATLSLPGLTIGLPVWLFSTQVIPNAVSASVVSISPQETSTSCCSLTFLTSKVFFTFFILQGRLLFHLLRRVKVLNLVTR
jgi:hypothetical protein